MGSVYAEPIGNIVEHKGSATLTREQGEELVVTPAFIPDVELNDTAETENGRMHVSYKHLRAHETKAKLV